MATDWFGSLGDERVAVEREDVQMRVTDKIAFLHAFAIFAGVSAEGQRLRSLQNRLTWVLMRKDGPWEIVHEHTLTQPGGASRRPMYQQPEDMNFRVHGF